MPHILCAGITVLDEIFQVQTLPVPGEKVKAMQFLTVAGGCAANAALTIVRLGSKARLVAPLGGPTEEDVTGDRVLAALRETGIDCENCVRIDGVDTPISGIFVDIHGERAIATSRNDKLDRVLVDRPDDLLLGIDGVLVDNHYPDFVMPICRAALRRNIPVVIDGDKSIASTHPLLATATHLIFSAECLLATTGSADLTKALNHMSLYTSAFLAVTDGPRPVQWYDNGAIREMPVFGVNAIDTLAAGDVFHGAFVLALVEGKKVETALRFAAAAAGLKCSKFGAGTAAPERAEVEVLLASLQQVR
jgi:sulfofructose kinase